MKFGEIKIREQMYFPTLKVFNDERVTTRGSLLFK